MIIKDILKKRHNDVVRLCAAAVVLLSVQAAAAAGDWMTNTAIDVHIVKDELPVVTDADGEAYIGDVVMDLLVRSDKAAAVDDYKGRPEALVNALAAYEDGEWRPTLGLFSLEPRADVKLHIIAGDGMVYRFTGDLPEAFRVVVVKPDGAVWASDVFSYDGSHLRLDYRYQADSIGEHSDFLAHLYRCAWGALPALVAEAALLWLLGLGKWRNMAIFASCFVVVQAIQAPVIAAVMAFTKHADYAFFAFVVLTFTTLVLKIKIYGDYFEGGGGLKGFVYATAATLLGAGAAYFFVLREAIYLI